MIRKLVAISAILTALLASQIQALPFESSPGASGRSAAMGGMQTILSRDAEAVLGNPSLLGRIDGNSIQAMTRDWYNSGLRSYAVSWARPLAGLGAGIAWHRFGMSDLWTENMVALAAAWSYQLPSGSLHLDLGSSLKLLQVAAPGYKGSDYQGDFTTLGGDLAATLEPLPSLRATWVAENFWAGEMSLLDGGQSHRSAPARQRWGLSFLWRDDLVFGFEYVKRQDQDAHLHLGGELGFFNAFFVRAGAGAGYSTAGFGLDGGYWQVDGAFESRGDLGASLVFSFRLQPWKLVGSKR